MTSKPMTIKITKTRFAAAVMAAAMVVPATALATHVFDDVPDGAFYAAPVEWAFNNGITTGTSPSTFSPLDNVTRGESVTFLERYNDNVVEPAIADAVATASAPLLGLFASDSEDTASIHTGAEQDLGLSASVTIPEGHTGVIEVTFSAESQCTTDGTEITFCSVDLFNNGTKFTPADFAFDSTNLGDTTAFSWEAHSITQVTAELPAGEYEITASQSTGRFGFVDTVQSYLADMTLTAQVHLTS